MILSIGVRNLCRAVPQGFRNPTLRCSLLGLRPTPASSLYSCFSTSTDDVKTVRQHWLVVAILGPPNAGKSTLFNRFMDPKSNRSYKLASEKRRSYRKKNKSFGRVGAHNRRTDMDGGAIVSAVPGTTRDRRECVGKLGPTYFTLVDTAGVDALRLLQSGDPKNDLEVQMIQQAMIAAKEADLILLMFDARVGVTTDLLETARWLRKTARPERKIMMLANKLEGDFWVGTNIEDNVFEATHIGFGQPHPISANHNEGMGDIGALIYEMSQEKRRRLGFPSIEEEEQAEEGGEEFDSEDEDDKDEVGEEANEPENENQEKSLMVLGGNPLNEKPLQLAILGRQNVGKSTLVNALLEEDRVLAGSKPGLTRDAISVEWSWRGRPVKLVDTAGIRRMNKRDHSNDIEELAVRDAVRAMKVADVAVVVLESQANALLRQELAICDSIIREGRALVVVANKMDLIVDAEYSHVDYAKAVREHLETRYPYLRKTPVLPMCSLTGDRVNTLMPIVFKARDRWEQRISTGLLNNWLQSVTLTQPPPWYQGRQSRIKYIVQTRGRPPTFYLFCNVPELPDPYIRFLTRNFQDEFDYFGMEVRLIVKRNSQNPYAPKLNLNKGTGVGGKEARKKRLYASLSKTGKPPPKRRRRKKR